MVRRRLAVILLRDGREGPAFTTVPTQVGFTIYAVFRPVDLLATLIRVAFSAGHKRNGGGVQSSTCVGLQLVDQRSHFVGHVE
jgi:hypothetical protein